MEAPTTNNGGKDGEKNFKSRLMGKLFKEKKQSPEDDSPQDVDSFLRGSPSDRLYMMPTNSSQTPSLARLDTNAARRWPTAEEIKDGRRRSTSQRRTRPSRKGLVVRFTEDKPEVIGEGGDKATSPVAEIGARRKRAHTYPLANQPESGEPLRETGTNYNTPSDAEDPPQLRRTQTGLLTMPDPQDVSTAKQPPTSFARSNFEPLDPDFLKMGTQDFRSFAADLKAEMRAAEGRALVSAASETSHMNQHFPRPESPLNDTNITPELKELHLNTINNTYTPPPPPPPAQVSISPTVSRQAPSPPIVAAHIPKSLTPQYVPPKSTGIPPQLAAGRPQVPSQLSASQVHNLSGNTPNISRASSNVTLGEDAMAPGEEALKEFSRRSEHLYTLFRLAAESVKPLPKCSPQQLVRVALWWFLKGRSSLERTIRERPLTPQSQQTNAVARQQAHADLAKALWIIENVISQYPQRQTVSNGPDSPMADLLSSQANIMSSLRKLSVSMKRNNILPPDPDDAPLPQGLDSTIWVPDDGERSLLASQRFNSTFSLSESFALGDTTQNFHYGRMFAEAVLLEEAASQYYRCHVLLSVVRGQKEKGITVTIASQDGLVNIGIQSDKMRGPTWDDVKWEEKANTLEMKMPRGFVLRLLCLEQDFKALWGLYDMHNEIYAILNQRPGEELIFEATVRTFQQFDLVSDSPSPREPLPQCHLRVFERTKVEKAANGVRTKHRGFRLGLCSNPKTKNLKGVDRTLLPSMPIMFGFLRGDGGLPALLLKSSDETSEHNIVLTFDDMNQRTRLHTLLTGVSLTEVEDVVAEAPLKSFSVTNQKNYNAKCLSYLDWQGFRIINETQGEVFDTKTVLSDHLRLVVDFKAGTITDRFNIAPGELKLRLNVKSLNELQLYRQPQQDITISISESQVMKEMPAEVTELLRIIGRYDTTRTYTFPSINELHLFQTALTGFKILFDGLVTSFNISRRRMVVPIYKKWDAAITRVQLIQKDNIVQLVAFFEDFSHGDCMNFALKSTDVFESSGKSSKHVIRIVDAKFALPKARVDGEPGDAPFVCLDMPEYPGEHDDVTVVFDSGEDREKFANALPAPVRLASRMASIRR